jgi:uncharacterized protein YkwD
VAVSFVASPCCARLPACALAALLATSAAIASPIDVVNEIRARGCKPGTGGVAAVELAPKLNEAARINASGTPLADSLKQVGYRAARSTSIFIRGTARQDEALGRVLRDRFCDDVLDAGYREFGTARRGKDVMVVFARPFVAPSPAQADAISEEMLRLVNEARANPRACGSEHFAAAPPVRLSAQLAHVALIHARDMARRGVMSHEGSDGSNVAERATRIGYQWRAVAENVSMGQETPAAALASWIASPGHCVNVMSPKYTEMGVAFADNPDSRAGTYWAQVFGLPRQDRPAKSPSRPGT